MLLKHYRMIDIGCYDEAAASAGRLGPFMQLLDGFRHAERIDFHAE
jgi:hypothetical protein